ncbi:hypothetical protein EI94DRAFT_1913235 [Lactarius quietus]|nr:hypothetical protein EI94DRAFT_1913235 [Lactarius quietus]
MSSVCIFKNTKAALLSLHLSLETVDPGDKAAAGIWVKGFSNALEDANNTGVAAGIDIEADPEIVAFVTTILDWLELSIDASWKDHSPCIVKLILLQIEWWTVVCQAAWDARDATKAVVAAGVSSGATTSPAVQSPVLCPSACLLPSLSSQATSPTDVLCLLEMAQMSTLPPEEYKRQRAGLLAASQGSTALLVSPLLSLKVPTGSQHGSQSGSPATLAPSAPLPLSSSLLLRQVEPAPSGSPAAMFSPAPVPSSPTLSASASPAATAALRLTRRAAASTAAVWSSQIPCGTKRGRLPDVELVAVSKAADAPPFPCTGTGPEAPCLQCHRQKIGCTQDGLPCRKVSAHASAPGAGALGTAPIALPSIDSEPLPPLPEMPYDSIAFDLLVGGGLSEVPSVSETNSNMFWWHQSICVKAQLRALCVQEHWVDQMYLKSLKQALFLTGRAPKCVKQDASMASGSGPALAKGKGKVKVAAATAEEDPLVVINVDDPDTGGPSGDSWLVFPLRPLSHSPAIMTMPALWPELETILPTRQTRAVYDSAVKYFLSLEETWENCPCCNWEVSQWLYYFESAWKSLKHASQLANVNTHPDEVYTFREQVRNEAAPVASVEWISCFPTVITRDIDCLVLHAAVLGHAQADTLDMCTVGLTAGDRFPDPVITAMGDIQSLYTWEVILYEERRWHLEKFACEHNEMLEGRQAIRDWVAASLQALAN